MSGDLRERVLTRTKEATPEVIAIRRDLHAYPEVGFTELRTASKVARRLTDLGFQVRAGREVVKEEARLGVPTEAELAAHYDRARADGADPEFLELVRGGFTGVVGEITGARPGPTIAMRFDIDALPILEKASPDHVPVQEGFVSRYPGVMHSCGHDGHVAIGLGVAEVLAAMKDDLAGRIRLIFQPAEEGCRGAFAMMEAGVVEGVDYFFSIHLGLGAPSGSLYPVVDGYLASTKLDVTYGGQSAHAGVMPEAGRSALICAAQAALGLHAIPRHSAGPSRVNVGLLHAGSGRNIIADRAFMMVETRGSTADIDQFVLDRAMAILEGTALAHGCTVDIKVVGKTISGTSDPELADVLAQQAALVPGLNVSPTPMVTTGSEDATYFMRRVQEQGGMSVYMGLGSDLPSGHHTPAFDVQERDFADGIAAIVLTMLEVGNHPPKRSA